MADDDMMPPQGLIESLAKDCRCCDCAVCHPGGVPCDGLLAGGMCDEATCRCDDEEECDDDE